MRTRFRFWPTLACIAFVGAASQSCGPTYQENDPPDGNLPPEFIHYGFEGPPAPANVCVGIPRAPGDLQTWALGFYLRDNDWRYNWSTQFVYGSELLSYQLHDPFVVESIHGTQMHADDLNAVYGVDLRDNSLLYVHGAYHSDWGSWLGGAPNYENAYDPYFMGIPLECYIQSIFMRLGEHQGNADHEWLSVIACKSANLQLDPNWGNEPMAIVSWEPAMAGIHGVSGFDGNMIVYGEQWQNDDTYVFAQRVTGWGGFDTMRKVPWSWSKSFRHSPFWYIGDTCPVTLVPGASETDAENRVANDTFMPVSFSDIQIPTDYAWYCWGGCHNC